MGPNKTSIIQIITGLEYGGAEQVVFDLVKNLNKSKFNVYVASITNKNHRLKDFKTAGIEPIILGLTGKFNFIAFLTKVWTLHKFLRDKQIKIIHAHLFHGLVLACILKTLNFNRKIVFSYHNILESFQSNHRIFFYLSKKFRAVDIVFSKKDTQYFSIKNKAIIPNGIEFRPILGHQPKNEIFTFLCVARLREQKNFQILPQIALEVLKRTKVPFQILIAGEGEMEPEISSQIKKFHVEHIVRLLGLQKNVDLLYQQAHVLLMPSLWEGMPITLLEAGLNGITGIVTPVGSVPEYFDESHIYIRDVPYFADTMVEILDNPEQSMAKSIKLQQHIKSKFLIENFINQHEKLYRTLNS